MIHPDQLIHSLSNLGNEFLKASLQKDMKKEDNLSTSSILAETIENSCYNNPWFIPSFVRFAFSAWAEALQENKVEKWLRKYFRGNNEVRGQATVGIIMAGNIPMVGLHDLICVLATGHHALIRLSSADDHFIPVVLQALSNTNPEFKNQFSFSQGPLKNFDAIIATGSNNSSRYFDYYFGKYPHIIRKNRNGIAVITGHETEADLRKLADDIFMYFGLGCRNVSKLYLPEGYKSEDILPYFNDYAFLADMHKYRNNYDYQKSILLINRIQHLDNGFKLIKADPSLMSPISVINTETYHSIESLNQDLYNLKERIQCIVSCNREVESAIPPGRSQFPELWDYADGTDTMNFLINL